jgi:hypothetical protein
MSQSAQTLPAGLAAALTAVLTAARAWLVVVGLALLLLLAPAAALAQGPQSWTLTDQAGQGWSLTLLEQADPAYAGGLRLRLTARSGGQRLDHQRPLQLRDGLGGSWELANRSGELVVEGSGPLPAGSAQFDLEGLQPAPRAELPLALEVPLQSGEPARLVAGADAVAALHGAAGGQRRVRGA